MNLQILFIGQSALASASLRRSPKLAEGDRLRLCLLRNGPPEPTDPPETIAFHLNGVDPKPLARELDLDATAWRQRLAGLTGPVDASLLVAHVEDPFAIALLPRLLSALPAMTRQSLLLLGPLADARMALVELLFAEGRLAVERGRFQRLCWTPRLAPAAEVADVVWSALALTVAAPPSVVAPEVPEPGSPLRILELDAHRLEDPAEGLGEALRARLLDGAAQRVLGSRESSALTRLPELDDVRRCAATVRQLAVKELNRAYAETLEQGTSKGTFSPDLDAWFTDAVLAPLLPGNAHANLAYLLRTPEPGEVLRAEQQLLKALEELRSLRSRLEEALRQPTGEAESEFFEGAKQAVGEPQPDADAAQVTSAGSSGGLLRLMTWLWPAARPSSLDLEAPVASRRRVEELIEAWDAKVSHPMELHFGLPSLERLRKLLERTLTEALYDTWVEDGSRKRATVRVIDAWLPVLEARHRKLVAQTRALEEVLDAHRHIGAPTRIGFWMDEEQLDQLLQQAQGRPEVAPDKLKAWEAQLVERFVREDAGRADLVKHLAALDAQLQEAWASWRSPLCRPSSPEEWLRALEQRPRDPGRPPWAQDPRRRDLLLASAGWLGGGGPTWNWPGQRLLLVLAQERPVDTLLRAPPQPRLQLAEVPRRERLIPAHGLGHRQAELLAGQALLLALLRLEHVRALPWMQALSQAPLPDDVDALSQRLRIVGEHFGAGALLRHRSALGWAWANFHDPGALLVRSFEQPVAFEQGMHTQLTRLLRPWVAGLLLRHTQDEILEAARAGWAKQQAVA
ncbi:MAG: hypothetical protein H6740_12495 [Alphaproteobacteria bacterium]|nr:hypothetical protein [Alphaproteobacteria bacterium]